MVKRYLFVFFTAMILTGCNCLPEGTPPEGSIVEAPDIPQAYNVTAAQNYMATALSTTFLQEFTPGKMIFIKPVFSSDNKTIGVMPHATLKSMRDMFSVVFSESAKYKLVSKISAVAGKPKTFDWEMKLLKGSDLLWKDSVVIDAN